MADEAYRAVFLRVHPTGKMVLSLTTESDGQEARYAQLVADELGVPALDVKVVAADTNRFGEGHSFNTSPSDGAPAAIASTTEKIRAKAQLLAGDGSIRAHATLKQSDFGIKQFSILFGALKVADEVSVEIDAKLQSR